MRVHLVTYATPRFRLRQLLLGGSARLNHVANTVTSWTPEMLRDAGFEDRCKNIKLSERGSGYWAWKPFIIDAKLREIPDGDLVFYCDVGRRYPFKELAVPVTPLVDWMESRNQDVVPGLLIPWKGPMAMWTKRDAFVLTGMDHQEIHQTTPIQASFSLWKSGAFARSLASDWLSLASRRDLISDDPSQCGLPELSEFHDHRHDQSLLTLCCLKNRIQGIDVGKEMPLIDTQHPAEVATLMSGVTPRKTLPGHLISILARSLGGIESILRKKVSFRATNAEPEYQIQSRQ
jgi:hypothetical protein